MSAGTTVKDLLQQAEQDLRALDSARLDAEILLCNVTGFDRSRLYAYPEEIVPEHKVNAYMTLVNERISGQPVAYLTGTREFWSIEFSVNQHTLIPRPETECLVEAALEHIPPDKSWRIADLGTGCGTIAIAIAKERPDCQIMAADISHDALMVAVTNAGKLRINNVSFVKSDWYSGLAGPFELIISNPPYVREDDKHLSQAEVRHEPMLALSGGIDGLQAIRQIISRAPAYLTPGGRLFIEHGYDQGETVRSILAGHQFSEIGTRTDYAGHERVSYGRVFHG